MSEVRRSKLIVITPGDPAGVGPEIVWKIIRSGIFSKKGVNLLCVGAREPFDKLRAPVVEVRGPIDQAKPAQLKKPYVWLLPAPLESPKNGSKERKLFLPGYQAGWSIERATQLALAGDAQALVTGPISKERLRAGGFAFDGHTEFLAHLCSQSVPGAKQPASVTMMLANDQLRVSLVTTHISVASVAKALTQKKILKTFNHTFEYLQAQCGIMHPKIAVLGLNPHAGEGGLFGNEEKLIITPAIRLLQKTSRGRYEVTGPHPADTFFAMNRAARPRDRYDAVICMYHDQALIPVKLIDFAHTVNVTLGLPIIRTSVDHGVAFDIAGKNQADASSMCSAIQLALALSGRRFSPLKKGRRS